ncbi:DUF3037 domain-containing protein [Endozoicomonas ascidiicola]|uniref:DUF3037 domain-containing protein n=1 Tax=Endozoicomonas ascidiicola TaxID=1698521 RepID=UPI000833EF79|nr:DUF3037 domain-containing protein [Endozoicomonas ascidiicola]
MTKYACRYAVVQFMPYPETGEFANVGVIAVVPHRNSFTFQLELTRYSRLTQFFHHLDHKVYLQAIKHLHEELQYLAKVVTEGEIKAQQAFELIVRPLEAILRFNHERVKMTEKPQAVAHELFDRFVQHDFAKKDNYEQLLQSRVTRLVRGLNLKHQFRKQKIGNLYPVTMPLVQSTDERRLRAIQPLHFNRAEPEKIIEHGNLWVSKLSTLKELKDLPADILIAVEKPEMPGGDILTAWNMVKTKLADFGDMTDASNDKTIAKFAKG